MGQQFPSFTIEPVVERSDTTGSRAIAFSTRFVGEETPL